MDAKTKQVTEQVITTGYSSKDIISLCVELRCIPFHSVVLTQTVIWGLPRFPKRKYGRNFSCLLAMLLPWMTTRPPQKVRDEFITHGGGIKLWSENIQIKVIQAFETVDKRPAVIATFPACPFTFGRARRPKGVINVYSTSISFLHNSLRIDYRTIQPNPHLRTSMPV